MHTMHQHRFNNNTCHIQNARTRRLRMWAQQHSTVPDVCANSPALLPADLPPSAFLRTSGTQQLGALCKLASPSPICRRQRQHRGPAGCLVATARMPILCQCSHVCRPEALPAEDGVQPLQLTASCS